MHLVNLLPRYFRDSLVERQLLAQQPGASHCKAPQGLIGLLLATCKTASCGTWPHNDTGCISALNHLIAAAASVLLLTIGMSGVPPIWWSRR